MEREIKEKLQKTGQTWQLVHSNKTQTEGNIRQEQMVPRQHMMARNSNDYGVERVFIETDNCNMHSMF